jgi:hypothetical protein
MAVTKKNAIFWDVTLVRIKVSEERSTSIIRMTRISELGTTLAISCSVRWLLVMDRGCS